MTGRKTPPSNPPDRQVTGLLLAWGAGDESAFEQLVPLVHEELRRLAHRAMGRERAGHTRPKAENPRSFRNETCI